MNLREQSNFNDSLRIDVSDVVKKRKKEEKTERILHKIGNNEELLNSYSIEELEVIYKQCKMVLGRKQECLERLKKK